MKKVVIITIAAAGVLLVALSLSAEVKDGAVFHITLADPELYQDGVFTETVAIDNGDYYFRFVPNGSSPEILTISLDGTSFNFSEDFELKGTLHETGISEYYTWEYVGTSSFEVLESQQITISIDPNGNILGSVSVDILVD